MITHVLLESAARTPATYTSPGIATDGALGGRAFLNVSAVDGSTATVKLQVQDPASGNWIDLPNAAFAAVSTTTSLELTVFPGVTASTNRAVSSILSSPVRAHAIVASGTSATFSVSLQLF